MAKNKLLSPIARRDLIKWGTFVGASLGLPRWKVFEVLEMAGGSALAQQAACLPTNRAVHIAAGNGGFAWFQLLWPHVDVARANNASFAFHAPGMATMAQGSDKPLAFGPEAPWTSLGSGKFVSAFMSGQNQTHTRTPTSSGTIATGVSLFAACAALQATTPTLVPVIGVNAGQAMMPFGAAAGSPPIANVGNSDGMVDLFNSAASSAMGALANPKDAALYEAYYKGFLGLSSAAGRSTMTRGLRTAKVASNLLGVNLAAQLRPSGSDLARYGIGGGSPTKLVDFAKALITTAKAFKLGLTSAVMMPAMEDDPHGAFANMGTLQMTVATLGKSLDAFLGDLAVPDPTCAGAKIADNVVLSIHGDTPKNPLDRNGWPDGTPNNSNWIYVMGNGYLRTGWHGGVQADGSTRGFDPATGAENNAPASATANAATAAIAYAIARGDSRAIQDFARGVDIKGITVPVQL